MQFANRAGILNYASGVAAHDVGSQLVPLISECLVGFEQAVLCDAPSPTADSTVVAREGLGDNAGAVVPSGSTQAIDVIEQAQATPGAQEVLHSTSETLFRSYQEFMESVSTAVARCETVTSTVSSRLGTEFCSDDAEYCTPVNTIQRVTEDKGQLLDCVQYIHCATALLLQSEHTKLLQLPVGSEDGNKFRDVLRQFARLHKNFKARGMLALKCPSITDTAFSEKLPEAFGRFIHVFGDAIHEAMVAQSIAKWISDLAEIIVQVGAVHEVVVRDSAVGELFNLLIPDSHRLIAGEPLDLMKDSPGESNDWMHNKTLQLLRDFLEEVLEWESLPVIGMSCKKTGSVMKRSHVLVALQMHCLIRDTACVGVALHRDMLVAYSNDPKLTVSHEAAFSYFVDALHLLQLKMASLDELLEGADVQEMEREGIKMWVAPSQLRGFVRGFNVWIGRSINILLKVFVSILESTVCECKKATPTWEACVLPTFKEEMAIKMMGNKAHIIAQCHTDVHQVLNRMALASDKLDVQPKLQFNDMCSEVIAVAYTTLSSAATAVVVCNGIDLIATKKHSASGPDSAKKFIEDNKVPKNSAIPETFWSEFEDWSVCAMSATPFVVVDRSCQLGGSESALPSVKQANASQTGPTPRKTKGESNSVGSSDVVVKSTRLKRVRQNRDCSGTEIRSHSG